MSKVSFKFFYIVRKRGYSIDIDRGIFIAVAKAEMYTEKVHF